jgi:bacillopeptidase F
VPGLWERGVNGAGVVIAVSIPVSATSPTSRAGAAPGSWFDPDGEHDEPTTARPRNQTAGLIVGGRAGGPPIGVAPGARFIAAKFFVDHGEASLSDIHLAFQWVLDPDGDPATDDLPQVVNNSCGFGLLTNECFRDFEPDVELLADAGIVVVFAAGNQGPAGATSVSPANYPESIAVGGVAFDRYIESTSGRGPTACTSEVYPDFVGPGVDVRTSDLTLGGAIPNPYAYVTGTSFATSHVTGAIALLRGAFPAATPAQLESALRGSATDLGEPGRSHVRLRTYRPAGRIPDPRGTASVRLRRCRRRRVLPSASRHGHRLRRR